MCAEIASGSHHWLGQHNESTVPLESRDKQCILSREMNLTETACSLESITSGEKAGTAWLTEQAGTDRKEWISRSPP
jgi:hypothetical protein